MSAELDRSTNPQGRYLFLKGKIQNRKYTFATLYVPNQNQAQHIRMTLYKLSSFTEGTLIVGGDLNVPLHPLLDSSTGHSLRLVDCWRATHPADREYTHYSALHKRYERIDYLFLQQEQLSALQSTEIGTALWLDHGPVTLAMDSPQVRPATWTWRLQDSLLLDLETRERVSEALTTYFDLNTTVEHTATTILEAHKSIIRGTLMRLASKKKKRIPSTDV
ncbi:Hypothetical predicted protein [Pelobates cultripes]|uniref:Endonuclease/exonuclease/phosphatase domain-containing protein n=1 Tax=Pelobates cultripes TaxID=61616 RepID=A0AAD1T0J0_PELCU|nr:Hypothetical predicted protein [Pelobates cultripes]